MTARPPLRLGTRRSPLALHQAGLARDAIRAVDDELEVELVAIDSAGDVDERELREIGERGIFASALERELAAGRIDAAVHSSKDLTLDAQPGGLLLAAWLPREDPRDALVGAGCELPDLADGARIATGSARRMAMLRTLREDLQPQPIRGNVTTRIERARERGDDGLVLAMAGLVRLGLAGDESLDVRPLDPRRFVPEAGQGAVVVQARAQVCDRTGLDWSRLDDVETRRTVQLERALARLLGGGCERPVGVHASLADGELHVFRSGSPDRAGARVTLLAASTELGTLVSVRTPRDVDDAAEWTALKLHPLVVDALEGAVREAAR